eukprot:763766-Hanusia_phi.AAC.1
MPWELKRAQVDLSWASLKAAVLVALPPSLVRASLAFSSPSFTVGEQMAVRMELRSALPAPLRLSALVARCTDSNFNFLLAPRDFDDRDLQLEEEERVRQRVDVGQELDLVPGQPLSVSFALPAALPASHLGLRHVKLVWGAAPT